MNAIRTFCCFVDEGNSLFGAQMHFFGVRKFHSLSLLSQRPRCLVQCLDRISSTVSLSIRHRPCLLRSACSSFLSIEGSKIGKRAHVRKEEVDAIAVVQSASCEKRTNECPVCSCYTRYRKSECRSVSVRSNMTWNCCISTNVATPEI